MEDNTWGENRLNCNNTFKICLTDYEMDLFLKCLIIGYWYIDEFKLFFTLNEKDKTNLYYLHKILSCKANKFFYNKVNDDFFFFIKDEK